jgi:hypothetical protein
MSAYQGLQHGNPADFQMDDFDEITSQKSKDYLVGVYCLKQVTWLISSVNYQ